MNHPIPAPITISVAKCFLTAKRDAHTVVARVYAVMGTMIGCGYSCATTEASAHELMAWPDGKPEFHHELFSAQKAPFPLPSSGRSLRVASFRTMPTAAAS